MALRFVLGSAGSGTIEYLQEEMLRVSEENPDRAVYCIVPDQATLQAQKELVAKQKNGCVMQVDILSFSRLKYRLSEELGDCFPPILTDIGKNMLLKKVLLSEEGKLRLYNTKHRKPGFLNELKSMLSELQRYLVDAQKLRELSEAEEDPILRDKLSDLSVVLSDFRALLGDRFLTEEDVYSAMCGPAERSKKLRNADFYLYGYTGFTPSQFLLLRSLLRVGHSVTFALSVDAKRYGNDQNGEDIFRMTDRTVRTLRNIAKEEGIAEEPVVLFPNRPDESALSFLKNHIFRRFERTYADEVKDVAVVSLPNREDEVRYLFAEIARLVQSEGYRYREIGVICGNVQAYSEMIEEYAAGNGVPCFIDYKTDVMNDPLVDFIRSLLRVFRTDFRSDAVVHYLKNRLSGFTGEEACRMENYLLAKGIRGASMYQKPFRYGYKTAHKDPLQAAEQVRERLSAELLPLREKMKNAADVSELVRILYDFLVAHKCHENMRELAESLNGIPGRKAARKCEEYQRIYPAVLELLDGMYELMGDIRLDPDEFAGVLEAGFTELKLGMIPPEQDSVTVGDVKRSRLDGVRCLFILGADEGELPGTAGGSGILTEKEREYLSAKKVELSETPKEGLKTEEFYLYLACAKPSDRLVITYHRTGESGRETKPSYVVYRILGLLPGLSVTDEKTDSTLFSEIAGDRAQRAYLNAFSENAGNTAGELTIRDWFRSEEGRRYAPMDEQTVLTAREGEPSPERIPKELAEALYGVCLRGGVTMLEKYAECGFRTFLERGLKLEERPEYEASPADIGSVMHEALFRFSKAVKESGKGFRLLEEREANDLMDKTIGEVLSEEKQEVFRSDRRTAYIAKRMKETLLYMTKVIREQLKAGKFEPEEFEKAYTYYTDRMELHGVIDRIDTYREDGRTLYKVVDYKSSDRALKYEEIYAGTSAQLPVYMNAMLREEPGKSAPAAMLYARLDDPYEEADDAEDAEKKRRKDVCPKGVVLNETDVISALDNTYSGDAKFKSDTIPTGDEAMLTEEEMRLLSDYAENLLKKEADGILSGNIRQNPINKNNQSTTCSYCPYTDFCTKRIREERNLFRNLSKLTKSEFFSKIKEDASETHG